MMKLTGIYNSALITSQTLDDSSKTQIMTFLNHPAFAENPIAIMPDCHAGAGAVIGFTMKVGSYIIPNIIGVDIGCGIEGYNLGKIAVDFPSFDTFIKNNIPSGFDVHRSPVITLSEKFFDANLEKSISAISKKIGIDESRVLKSIGTLGGGNHFIELGRSPDDDIWLTIHTGSRNFGLKIAEYHQAIARKLNLFRNIHQPGLESLETDSSEGKSYFNDMKTAQLFAESNRRTIAEIIIEKYFKINIDRCENIKSVHNYISSKDSIIRKGAISAYKNEKLIIPLNMRDGIIIAEGKGNKDWNFSAPHGAGRLYSRTEAKRKISMDSFVKSMEGIWSSSISKSTLDESPMAYKSGDEIRNAASETFSVKFIIKPVYSFKAQGN